MAATTWQTQTKTQPLFPDLLWARPERQDQAGKLLIVGGSVHGFASVVKAIEAAHAAGIGEVKAVLPKGVEKYVGHKPELLYASQTVSGSFAKSATPELLSYLSWASGLLLPGELTNNAETTICIDNMVKQANVPIVVTGEALDLLIPTLDQVITAPLTIVASLRQLQTLVVTNPLLEALVPHSTLEQRVRLLHQLIERITVDIIVLHDHEQYLVVGNSQASLTQSSRSTLEFAAHSAVLTTQFPGQLFEAVTTAALELA